MYYYGSGNSCCSNNYPSYAYPMTPVNNNSSFAIILVIFILLVVVLGTRFYR